MVLVQVFLIFLAINTATWVIGLTLFKSWVGPDVTKHEDFPICSVGEVLLVTMFSFVPFPWGYYLTLGAWWIAAEFLFELPFFRAVALFLILGGLSFLSRLAVLGVLNF